MCRVWRVGVTRDYLFEIRHENETRERYIYIYKIRVEEVEFLNRLLCSKSLVLEREESF